MISDNDLLLYYYRDGLEAAERERIASKLSEEPELAARLHRLVARLDAAARTREVPVPEHVQRRWQAALREAASNEATDAGPPRHRTLPRLGWHIAAAALASVVLVVSVMLMQSARDDVIDGDVLMQAAAEADRSSAYARGLRLHLASTQTQLAGLDSASDAERIKLIETIIAQNRLYAIAAERADEPQLARVLRAFTPILERLAEDRGEASADEIAQLDFEMKVMQARLAATSANRPLAQSPTL